MVIDPGTEKGGRADARLRDELVVWLITVSADGSPVPTPVWFWWDGETVLVYSQRDKPKLRHIAANPRVSVAMRTDELGDEITVLAGEAVVDPSCPRPPSTPAIGRSTRTSSRDSVPTRSRSPANTRSRSASRRRSCANGGRPRRSERRASALAGQLRVPAPRVDDDQPRGLVADRLGVVRQRPVQQDVVARPGLDDRLALGDADAARQDDVMLVAGVGMEAGAMAGGMMPSKMARSRAIPPSTWLRRPPCADSRRLRPIAARTRRGADARDRAGTRRSGRRARSASAASVSSDGDALSFSTWLR